ncbi:hypothetical protein J8273_5294 [Carpediemonas membranifera]|uniref:Uncharacterized protein n=1 Tax=Carpediemonas membranifera TaxID=201153 RepID=A0A8J6E8R8_9EUKA|nr:hypothetical protein J8273_5294 [Carpediemonas membranifera]|eukprot:KAG9392305.1 hypothetical protein J8273_5294 [Carpediemonas membranifera]
MAMATRWYRAVGDQSASLILRDSASEAGGAMQASQESDDDQVTVVFSIAAWKALGRVIGFSSKISEDICFVFYYNPPSRGLNPSSTGPVMATRVVHSGETIFANVAYQTKFFTMINIREDLQPTPADPLFYWLPAKALQTLFTYRQDMEEITLHLTPLSFTTCFQVSDGSASISYAVRCVDHDTYLAQAHYAKRQSDIPQEGDEPTPTLSVVQAPPDLLKTRMATIASATGSSMSEASTVQWTWAQDGLTLQPGGGSTMCESQVGHDVFSGAFVVAPASFKTDLPSVTAFLAMCGHLHTMLPHVTISFLPPPSCAVLTVSLHNVVEIDLVLSTEYVEMSHRRLGSTALTITGPNTVGRTPVLDQSMLPQRPSAANTPVRPDLRQAVNTSGLNATHMSFNNQSFQGEMGMPQRPQPPRRQQQMPPPAPQTANTPHMAANMLGAGLGQFSAGPPVLFSGHSTGPAHFRQAAPRKFTEIGGGVTPTTPRPQRTPAEEYDRPDPRATPVPKRTMIESTQISDGPVQQESSRVLASASQNYSQVNRMRAAALPELNAMFSDSDYESD